MGKMPMLPIMNDPSLRDLLDLATESAYLAGRRTLSWFNTPVPIEIKRDNTPVTCADRESEQIIRAQIARFFPDHAILGEEGGATQGNPDYRWIIDPIDGTKTFLSGVPLYAVLIGVEVKQQPAVGVIYLPALDEMIAAATGLGCRWNGRTARVSSVSRLQDAVVVASSISTCMARSDAFERLATQTKLQRTWGDAYGYALVATGRADIMLDSVINPWDIAPMLPILHEAAGRFSDWQGQPTIWSKDALATNPALHPQVLEILQHENRR
jgi:histidinol phosphatase-like enzyme (inositol monophosphatase family)